MRCPGQDMRYWKPGDIFEAECPKCGRRVEFFKDEVRRKCPCGHEIVNPKMNLGCAVWCPYAEQCLGSLPAEIQARKREEQGDFLKERIALEMKKYFGTDFKRVKHAIKVAQRAEEILKVEGGNPLVVLGAAYLQEIGIHEAERRHGNAVVHPQELEDPSIAQEILERLEVGKALAEEIYDIISHPHRPREDDTLNFQILYEADLLAHLEETGCSKDRDEMERLIRREFRTTTGRKLAKRLCGN